MKITSLAVLVVAHCFVGLAMVASAPGQTFTLSNTTKNLGTTKVATRKVDGLTITYPADEADVVELLLPAIAKYRAVRREGAKAEAEAVIEAISAESLRKNYRTQIPRLIALKVVDEKAFDARFDAALKEVVAFIGQWEKWSGELSALNFWNYATGQIYEQDQRAVFPEISYGADPKTGGTEFSITPPQFRQAIGIDLLRPPALRPFRLDLPLYYKSGASAAELASIQRDLLGQLPVALQKVVAKLASTSQTCLTEAVVQAEIRAGYFTPAAASTPEGETLIRALARLYLFASLKSSGKITDDNLSEKLSELLFFPIPAEPEAAAKFLRAFESLNPFSGKLPQPDPASAQLAVAASRIVTLTLFKLAQGGDDDGSPILQKLRSERTLPAYGFKSVASFTEAVEAAYPAKFKDSFLAARAELAAALKKKIEASAAKVEPAPATVAPAPPLPDRETQVFDGLTITHPAALRGAVAKLGPELAGLSKEARKRIEERFGKDLVPPVPITDATLESIRGVGLQASRVQADMYAMQGAMLANASQILVRIFDGSSVQVWFKNDLKALLKAGREIPGFSYDPVTDKGIYKFTTVAKGQFDAQKPLTLDTFKEMLASQQPPVYAIVLNEHGIADIKDADAQVAAIRKEDPFTIQLLQAAGTITPEQLGIGGGELSHGLGLSAQQALFSSVHELVETTLVEQVIASADRRWFCEGVANLLAIRACDRQLGEPGGKFGLKVFESLFDPASLGKRAAEIDLAAWPTVENEPAQKDDSLTHAHYYFATRVLLAATEGREEAFLKTWIAKIRETPWNRANAATIIAAYHELTGTSLRDLINKTVSAPAVGK